MNFNLYKVYSHLTQQSFVIVAHDARQAIRKSKKLLSQHMCVSEDNYLNNVDILHVEYPFKEDVIDSLLPPFLAG